MALRGQRYLPVAHPHPAEVEAQAAAGTRQAIAIRVREGAGNRRTDQALERQEAAAETRPRAQP
jgi:hypothetical protein